MLRDCVIWLFLTYIYTLCVGPNKMKNRLCDQSVVKNNVRFLHQTQGLESKQVWIARTGANKIDFALHIRLLVIVKLILYKLSRLVFLASH